MAQLLLVSMTCCQLSTKSTCLWLTDCVKIMLHRSNGKLLQYTVVRGTYSRSAKVHSTCNLPPPNQPVSLPHPPARLATWLAQSQECWIPHPHPLQTCPRMTLTPTVRLKDGRRQGTLHGTCHHLQYQCFVPCAVSSTVKNNILYIMYTLASLVQMIF